MVEPSREQVPVAVEGRSGRAREDDVEALHVVRLLPPSDPYLQGRDRELRVPDPAHRPQIRTSIGAPGVVVSRLDVVGVWRPTHEARRLEIAVTPFRALDGGGRAAVASDAERLGVVRGAAEVRVV